METGVVHKKLLLTTEEQRISPFHKITEVGEDHHIKREIKELLEAYAFQFELLLFTLNERYYTWRNRKGCSGVITYSSNSIITPESVPINTVVAVKRCSS